MSDPQKSTPLEHDALIADLAERYFARLQFFAIRRLGDATAAEDVAQETLRRTVQALRDNRVHTLEGLPSYLFQTAENICLQEIRSNQRRRSAFLRWRTEVTVHAESRESALDGLIARQDWRDLLAAVGHLDDEERSLLRLFYVDGLSSEEVARRLGIQAGAARVRKHRILQKIVEAVEGGGNVLPGSGTI